MICIFKTPPFPTVFLFPGLTSTNKLGASWSPVKCLLPLTAPYTSVWLLSLLTCCRLYLGTGSPVSHPQSLSLPTTYTETPGALCCTPKTAWAWQ